MATESSAVVRFISTAEREGQAIPDSATPAPEGTDDLPPIRRPTGRPASAPAAAGESVPPRPTRWRGSLLAVGALALASGAGVLGVYVGKQHAPASSPGAGAGAPAPAAAPAAVPAPQVAPAPSVGVAPEVLAETGFDIRVKPPAVIRLDGRVLGMAPLRVRNLNPGAHSIDIEAPAGFFSRRVDIELDAGEPQNVNLALDPIEAAEGAAAAPRDERGQEDDRARRERRRPRRRPAEAQVPAAATPAAEKGTLMLGSKPPCDIYIDGAPTGLKTPQRAIELAPGTHRVTLINADLALKTSFTVEITAGRSTRSIHDLTGKLQ